MNELNLYTALQADGEYLALNEFTALEANVNTIDAVVIVAPTEGQEDFVRTSAIDWEAFRNYTRYRVRLATDAEFATVVETVDVDATEVAGIIDTAGDYWVKVTPLDVVSPTPPEPEATIDSITITGGTTLQQNGTRDLVADVQKTGDIDDSVTWESSNEAVATVQSTGSKTARVTYVSGAVDATVTITATAVEDNQVSDDQILAIIEQPSGVDSEAGDIATLEALAASTNAPAQLTGWATSGMTLDPAPEGVTVEEIDTELRVRRIAWQGKGITGDIEINNWFNLQKLQYLNIYINSLDTQIPQVIMDLPELVYLYICKGEGGSIDYTQIDPHEVAPTGSGDNNPANSKGGESNIIRGTLPGPTNPAQSNLRWLWCNWSDSAVDAQDGISAIDPNLFLVNFEGFQIINNNNIEDTPWPAGISNMSNANQLAFGVEKSGRKLGPFTGELPANFGDNLSLLKHFRIRECPGLFVDYDAVDFSGMVSIRTFLIDFIRQVGQASSISYLVDGTCPNVLVIHLSGTEGETGLTGAFPEVAQGMNIKVFQFQGHSLTSLPASLWHNCTSIIQPNFTGNQLTTIGTDDLTGQYQMRYLRLSGNLLHENIPYIDWANHEPINGGVEFGDNRYVFKHFLYVPPNAPNGETCLELWQTISGNDVSYGNQKRFGSQDNLSGDIIDFSSILTHEDNVYEWYLDGVLINDETTASIDTSVHGTGQYELRATNINMPGLTLRSVFINI